MKTIGFIVVVLLIFAAYVPAMRYAEGFRLWIGIGVNVAIGIYINLHHSQKSVSRVTGLLAFTATVSTAASLISHRLTDGGIASQSQWDTLWLLLVTYGLQSVGFALCRFVLRKKAPNQQPEPLRAKGPHGPP